MSCHAVCTSGVPAPMILDVRHADDAGTEQTSDSRHVGPFRLLRRIGTGGFGTVFEAWDARLGRAVALKLLHRPSDDARTQLLAEARAAASLEHRAFVRVLEVIDEDGALALVLELVRGQTLADRLAQGPIPLTQALDWTAELAEAMAEAHRVGLVHGDLKPANLMVDQDNRLRILDFGLARRPAMPEGHATTSHPGAGTLAYMAPELLLGAPPSAASDAYAIGMLLGDMLTGTRPHAAFDGGLLAHAIVHGQQDPHVLPDTIPDAVKAIVVALGMREPAARLVDMDTLRSRIQSARGDRRRSPPTHAAIAPSRRTRWPFILAVLLGFAAILAWAWRPLETWHQQERLARAEALLMDFDRPGALDETIAILEQMLTHDPEHAAAAADLAIAHCLRYAGTGRDEAWLVRAATAAEVAVRRDDQLARAHAAMGWTLEFRGQADPARTAYARALVLDPGERYALIGSIRLETRQGDFAAAKSALDTALRRHPEDRVFIDALGTWFFRQAQYADAEAAFRRAIAIQPDSVGSYGNLNAALLRQGRTEDALAVLQQGLRIRPDGRLYANLGTVLFSLGRYPEAAEAFQRAVSPEHGSPNDYLRWSNLADALRHVPGREEASKQAYVTALGLMTPLLTRTPDDVTILSRAALVRAKLGQCRAALADADRARPRATADGDALFRLAHASELCDRRTQAFDDLITALHRGYPIDLVLKEPDLVALRRDPRFQMRVLGDPAFTLSHQPGVLDD